MLIMHLALVEAEGRMIDRHLDLDLVELGLVA